MALEILADAVEDILKKKRWHGVNLSQGARTWIFADRFTKDFEFWCEVAGIEPEAIRLRLKRKDKKYNR